MASCGMEHVCQQPILLGCSADGRGVGASALEAQVQLPVQVSIYLTEGDSWLRRPLHLEILKYLRDENVARAVALHSVAGFLGRSKVRTAHLVEAGGELPVVVSFVDTDEHVIQLLPKLREMAAHRLIVREKVTIEQGGLD